MRDLEFKVLGLPKPQGSKTGFPIKRKNGKIGVSMVESAGEPLKAWRGLVREAASKATNERFPGAVAVSLRFYLSRPKSHYGTGRNDGILKDSAPDMCVVRPDSDKLARAVLDSLTDAGVYVDDSHVVSLTVWKAYADARFPGADVTILDMTS